jgi:ATP-dependent DNA helicase RecG
MLLPIIVFGFFVMRPESLFYLFSPVSRVKGVGDAMTEALVRLLPPAMVAGGSNLPIVRDLLFHLPVGIVDRGFTCPLGEVPDGVVGTFVVTVELHQPPPRGRAGRVPYKVICGNETGDITLVFFGARDEYIKQSLPVGQQRVISGRVEYFDHRLQMTHPDIIAPLAQLEQVRRCEPVYPLTVGLTARRLAKLIETSLEKLPVLPEWIAPALLEKYSWPAWHEALLAAHQPQSQEDISPTAPARLRLAYDEMLARQLHLALLRQKMQKQAGRVVHGGGALEDALRKALPFTLTHGQEEVLREIAADMASGGRMARLLQGDVGSGKTIVALFAMLRVVEQGAQAALMVPTEIISQQHFETLSKLVEKLGVHVVRLTGSIKGKKREQALAEIQSGKAQIVIGTHALFQEHVEFADLALVVIDEQHRFGVAQRMALVGKGNAPHLLHMTATPIPRSLTMTLYGDMDASQLTEKPAGRKPIATRLIPLSRYEEVMERLAAALARGEKIYWICPLIEDNSEQEAEEDVAAAESRRTEFAARFGAVVGMVHGRMKADSRDEEMQRFASGQTRLLVATTVVEVGVDVRDATIIVIEKAERFGLSQLHQLRGRVGRGDQPSSCVLLYTERKPSLAATGEETDAVSSRLTILRETEDGFKIAEADLAIRGEGDLLGTRQSGVPRSVFTDLFFHQEWLVRAREDVREYLTQDAQLQTPRGQALRTLLFLFGYDGEVAA